MIAGIPRRNINEGWLTFPDGRQAPVYTFNHFIAGTTTLPVWSDARLAQLEAGASANGAKKARWRKESALTQKLLDEHGGRIRALVVRHDDDQSPIFMGEFCRDGDILTLVERRDRGSAAAFLLDY